MLTLKIFYSKQLQENSIEASQEQTTKNHALHFLRNYVCATQSIFFFFGKPFCLFVFNLFYHDIDR